MTRFKSLKIFLDFFSSRKLISILVFIIFIIINIIDISIVFIVYQNIIQIIFSKNFYNPLILITLIFSRIFFYFINKTLIKFDCLIKFCNSLKKIFLFFPFNKSKSEDFSLKKNLLKIQIEIDWVNFNGNKVFYKIIQYFSGLFFFSTVIIVINYNLESISFSKIIIFFIFFLSALTNFYFEKKISQIKEKIKSKIENDLISSNYEISEFIDLKKNEINQSFELFEKKIDNEIEIFKNKSKKTIFFCNSEYLFYITQFFYFFITYLIIFYLNEKENSINSFILFYITICFIFYQNLTKFLNIFFNKKTFYFLTQGNIINYNTYNQKKEINNEENENKENLSIFENNKEQKEDDLKKIEKIIKDDKLKNKQISIESIQFKNISLTHPELKTDNQNHYLENINLTIKKKSSTIIISNDNSNIQLFTFLKNLNFKIKSGEILINEKEIGNFPIELIENAFFVVNSTDVNFELTIRENILQENQEIPSDEIIIRALKITGLFDFINSLSLSYHSLISEDIIDEIKKFQISLTKCFLGDAQVIILDFSSLKNEEDPSIERIKLICLEALKDRIIIFITNNAFGIELASQVILIEKNQIIASGSHEKLTKDENKAYLRFYLKKSKIHILEGFEE